MNAGTNTVPVTVILLTYNEERNVGRCIASVAGWAEHIFVVDSGSTDNTQSICRAQSAVVVEHSFQTHSKQWDWALKTLPISTDWILTLDADQFLTDELRKEITAVLTERPTSAADNVHGYYIKRRQVFRGRWIRHGGYYPKYLLKLFRRGSVATNPADLVDHHFYLTGRAAYLRYDLIEDNQKENDISFWIEKHNRYSTLLAREETHFQVACGEQTDRSLTSRVDQRFYWRKKIWSRLPLYGRPVLYFLYRYVLRLGFLDGKEGFIFHFMQACWFRLLVDIKVEELRKT